jgi:hypothetical protein
VPRDRRRHRTQESAALLGLQVVATAVHIVPRLVYAQRQLRTTTRIVAALADLGPAWVVLFGVTALGLGAALWWRRGQTNAHVACGAVWVMYDMGLWLGALADTPRGTVFFPIVVLALVVVHAILAASYNEDADTLEQTG